MKAFLFSILGLSLLYSVNSQIANIWTLDWQNSNDVTTNYCLPENFTIGVDNSNIPVNVTYYFGASTANPCPANISSYTFSNLSAGATANTYIDSFEQQLLYNSSFNFIQFTKPNVSSPILYSINGSFIPIKNAYYPLFGLWHNPQQTNSSDHSVCCTPDEIFITETIEYLQPIPGEVQLTMYYTSSNCSTTITQILNVWNSEVTTLNFGNDQSSSTTDLIFLPNGLNSLMDIVFNFTYNACRFSYEKIDTTTLINGTWVLDWQSINQYFPKLYQIYQVNNTYMGSSFRLLSDQRQGYVSQNFQEHYYDSILQVAWEFANGTNTLLDGSASILYSPHGSLFSANDFIKNWSNPQTTADTGSCCIPSYIQITQDYSQGNNLSAVYYYPDSYEETEGCQDFGADISGGEFQTVLSIKTPSVLQLIWTDDIGNRIYWANPSDPSQIAMSVVGQCNFTMTITNDPPPTPNPQPTPLSGRHLSIARAGLMMGLFIMSSFI